MAAAGLGSRARGLCASASDARQGPGDAGRKRGELPVRLPGRPHDHVPHRRPRLPSLRLWTARRADVATVPHGRGEGPPWRGPAVGGAPPGGTISCEATSVGASRTWRRIVFDPEDGWIRVRRNLCRVDRRWRAAHVADLLRLVAVLDEHGSVRGVGPVGRAVAEGIELGHLARKDRYEIDARLVIPAAVATWSERDRLDTNVGRTLGLELDPVAVQLDGLVVVRLRDEKRRHPSGTGRSESHGRDGSDDRNTGGRNDQTPLVPVHPWHDLHLSFLASLIWGPLRRRAGVFFRR